MEEAIPVDCNMQPASALTGFVHDDRSPTGSGAPVAPSPAHFAGA